MTECFYPTKCYNNSKVCCCKDEQQSGVVFLWLKFSWGADLRLGEIMEMKPALLLYESRFFNVDLRMMRCCLGHRCSTTKLIVVPSKEGGAIILGPCCVVMLITGFLSELAALPVGVTGSCSAVSPVAL